MLISQRQLPLGAWHFPSALDNELHLSPIPRMSFLGREDRRSHGYQMHGGQSRLKPYLIFQLTLAGEGRLKMGGRRYSCREGQAFMVLSDMDYSYGLPASSSSWELLYINLSGLPVLQYARAVLDQHGPIYDISEPHHRHMHSLLVEIFAKARGGKGLSEQTESRLAWSLLMEVFDSSIMNQQSSGSWLTLIQDHVKGNLQSDISVAELASLSGYSEFHFSRKFKAATGISPSQFVRNTRMQLAQQMLKQERYSIQEVCQATGFKDQSHFGKCFKQSFGCSPKRFQMEYL